MSRKLYTDTDKYAWQSEFPLVEAYNSAVKYLVRKRFAEFGVVILLFLIGLEVRRELSVGELTDRRRVGDQLPSGARRAGPGWVAAGAPRSGGRPGRRRLGGAGEGWRS